MKKETKQDFDLKNLWNQINVGIRFFKSKSCFISFFTNPYIRNHFKMNVFVTCVSSCRSSAEQSNCHCREKPS